MYNVKDDYITRLRHFLLHSSSLLLSEDAENYAEHYDPALLQGFLVWNHSAYIAKEYEVANVQRVDFYVIPVFGALDELNPCQGIQYLGVNIDMHRDIDPTGQRLNLVAKEIKDWHRSLLTNGSLPAELNTHETYMILPNGVSPIVHLASMPYSRLTVKYKLDYLSPLVGPD